MYIDPTALEELNNSEPPFPELSGFLVFIEITYNLNSLRRYINYQHLAVKAYIDFRKKELEGYKLSIQDPKTRTFKDPDLGIMDTYSIEEMTMMQEDEFLADKGYFNENIYNNLLHLVMNEFEKSVFQICKYGAELQDNSKVFNILDENITKAQSYWLHLHLNDEAKLAKTVDMEFNQALYTHYKDSLLRTLDPELPNYIHDKTQELLDDIKKSPVDYKLVMNAYYTISSIILTIENAFSKTFPQEIKNAFEAT
jgi:hypothetical protein